MRSAVILAGGRSSRFGERDKALATVAGTPMIRCVAERVAPVVDELVVNCREDQRQSIGRVLEEFAPRFVFDPVEDRGPIAGLRATLQEVRGQTVAVLPCDMPRADPTLLEHLFAACETAAAPRVEGRLQPLHAVYDVATASAACDRALSNAPARLYDVLDRVDPAVVDLRDVGATADAVANVNTRDDLRALDGTSVGEGGSRPR